MVGQDFGDSAGFGVLSLNAAYRVSQQVKLSAGVDNLLDKNYAQVAFNSPFQEGAATAAFQDPQYPGGRQLFSQFLAEPRTYGVTLRGRF